MLPWQAQLELVRSLLTFPASCQELLGVLKPEHFENPALGAIADAAMTIYSEYGAVATEGQVHTHLMALPDPLAAAALALLPDVQAAAEAHTTWVIESGRKVAARAELLRLAANARGFVDAGQFDAFLSQARQAAQLAAPRGFLTKGAGNILLRHTDGGPPGVPLSVKRVNANLKGNGLQPGRLLIYLGVENGGKTQAMTSDGAYALLRGYRVMHATLEDSAEDVRWKYDKSLSGFGDDFIDHLPGVQGQLEEWHSRLHVLEATDRALTVQGLRAALDRVPDDEFPHLLIVDYGQLMHSGVSHTGDDVSSARRMDLSDIYQQLRILGQLYKVPVITAYQSNRQGFMTQDAKKDDGEPNVLRARHFSDAIGPAFHADVILSINQTPAEMTSRVGRIFIDKNRCGRKGIEIGCVFRWDKARIRDITDPELLAAGGTSVGPA